ncbi:MAG TPA: AAA family ATPase, partial [Candidatus Limnocylindrales bacterium]|nr:AAA family ATPase [Candidatus Limnocylindrales bacterium]
MTAPRARLRALRLSGFKSFAERTVLEFGPGISAVIGPNGSGKSNLADALRWALGEQGRSLRTRRSEDVIFAGSAKRHATGMADVSLVVDNADRLLPVDYGEIDFGRRLFRSGENEYLLNRQRIRLRDLVELLDSANLADNAFLFIGQGMVDQALSLRPEERRPLFEEVAGVRRHERRRRRAEEQLLEAEANLARVRDILGELRPQARRLAAQAEQQAARSSAADDFAAAIVASAWWRFRETAAGAASAHEGLEGARGAADEALTELRAAEEAAASLAERLASRAADERRLRTELDELLVRSTELRLAEGRAAADLEARRRDLARLTAERAGAEERLAEARRTLALPAPEPAPVADSALAEVERELAMAEAELEAVRRSGEREASLRRMAVARAAEVDRLRRRAADTERELGAAQARLETARAVLEEARRESDTARARLAASETHERAAEAALESARGALQAAEARLAARMTQLGSLRARAEAAETRAASLAAGLEADASDAMTAAAVRLGGRRLTDGLDVDPAFAPAVEAALDDAIRAAVLPAADLDGLGEAAQAGGSLVLAEAPDAHHAGSTSATREVGRALDAVLGAGGGRLADVVRRDPSGAMATLLRAVLWVPDMAAALAVRSALPAGWRVVTPAGDMVSAEGVVRLRRGDSILARRAEYERLAAAAAALRDDAGRAALQEAEARTAAEYARAAADEARVALDAARSARRATEDSERAAARRGEAAGREAAWEEAQVERLGAALERERQALAAAENESAPDSQPGAGDATGSGPAGAGSAPHRAWQDRLDQLRARRDALASEARAEASRRQQAAEARRRAEVALAMEERHLAELDEQAGRLMAAEATLASQTERLAGEVAGARELEEQARAAVEALGSEDAADREQLAGHERAASAARERLRLAEERSRSAEVAEMEARLQ